MAAAVVAAVAHAVVGATGSGQVSRQRAERKYSALFFAPIVQRQ